MLTNFNKSVANFLQKSITYSRWYSTDIKKVGHLQSMAQSISDKGFLRPYKTYEAPSNVTEKVHGICISLQIPDNHDYVLKSLEEKFEFLQACFNDFRHSVPNSQIHELNTVGDAVKFYQTSVNTTVPYEALKQMQLPENLHIQYDYVRFNPENDTMFNGQTAFPKSSTLVTGLKYRGKYDGHEAKQSWP